jgi:hypothetical protein
MLWMWFPSGIVGVEGGTMVPYAPQTRVISRVLFLCIMVFFQRVFYG